MGVFSQRIDSIIERVKRQADEAERVARKEYAQWLKSRLSLIYHEVIQDWYDAYEPAYYQRNKSLFDIMDLTANDDGSADMEYSPANITPTRDGNRDYIYWLTFKMGFHGGASNAEVAPVLRYRRPVGYWNYWGSIAKHSPAPYFELQRRVDRDLPQRVVNEKYQELINKHMSRISVK